MELIRRVVPYDASAALKLLEDTFGYEEVVVEAPQLMGKEGCCLGSLGARSTGWYHSRNHPQSLPHHLWAFRHGNPSFCAG